MAILGALAWVPQLIQYSRDYFSRPKVRLITGVAPEIGFSTFGPIINIRFAFVVERKDFVISGIKIYLKHSSDEEKMFGWQVKAIHATLEAQARAWGLPKLHLDSTVKARLFYEAIGYKPSGEAKHRFGVLQCYPYEKVLQC